ncbi:MAG: hypothetical protein KDH15_13075 [Rhodocyclaceae bacterium]|nr:hypothetical protein [Rhodocyclaceae bacterium]
MSVTRVLTLPLRLDALFLAQDAAVVGPSADFSRLPYRSAGRGDRNGDLPWLSEPIVPQPFDEPTLVLKAGVHLHWALPDAYHVGTSHGGLFAWQPDAGDVDALDRRKVPGALSACFAAEGVALPPSPVVVVEKAGEGWLIVDAVADHQYRLRRRATGVQVYGEGVRFPPVPTRWLVQRRWRGTLRRWIVESDYIHPPDAGIDGGARQAPIHYPTMPTGTTPPFVRLGRVRAFEGWTEESPMTPKQFLAPLTAVGYGDPHFAVLYANCHSVFGFHDAEIARVAEAERGDLEYQLVGWHVSASDDPLRSVQLHDALALVQARDGGSPDSADETARVAAGTEALDTAFGWQLPDPEAATPPTTADLPERIACLASVTVECAGAAFADSARRNECTTPCVLAIGHTGSEAVSAYAAWRLGGDTSIREDQLEALHLAPKLDGLRIDIGPKFREARHEKAFSAVDAGSLWTVTAPEDAAAPVDPRARAALRGLNAAQFDLDRREDELVSLRRQVYADWSKYLVCAYPPLGSAGDYPDMDALRAFIEAVSLPAVARNRDERDAARRRRDVALASLESVLAAQPPEVRLELKRRPAPRYWRPNEPVLLIAGESVEATVRHGVGGRLRCGLEALDLFDVHGRPTRDGLDALAGLAARPAAGEVGHCHCRSQPWQAVFLDWQVALMPFSGGDNIAAGRRRYDPAFLSRHFDFDPAGADLQPAGAMAADFRAACNRYQGRSILTPDAGSQLRAALAGWLTRELKPDPGKDFVAGLRAAVADGAGVAAELVEAYATLFDDGAAPPFMTQALTGFNAALLMQRQTLQLPVHDPLGFAADRAFADRVAAAVDDQNRFAAAPLDDFNPIRAGRLRILALRLVDTFGQRRDVTFDPEALVAADAMRLEGSSGALLRPRLAQPAQLDFRWLAAADEGRGAHAPAASELPDDTPLCGWLVHDLTENCLRVHAAGGAPLGVIGADRQWRGAPGVARLAPWQLPDPHLARLVDHLLADPALGEFIAALEGHADRIAPESFAEHDSLALMLGRPLAVVRARLQLRLQGLPAFNQDWNVMRRQLAAGAPEVREHDGFEQVRFPVRLGDPGQLGDGLVAFWEERHLADGRCLCQGAAQTCAVRSTLSLSIAGGPVAVTMLLDPRAAVHARTGILPTKAITLAKPHYVPALAAMALAVRVGPVLSPQGAPELFAPASARYQQSWLQQVQGEWIETRMADPPEPSATRSGALAIREGWIKLVPTGAGPD